MKKKQCLHWSALFCEVALLQKQRCIYCSGYGHYKDDCPTGHKLQALRLGTDATVAVFNAARSKMAEAANMANVKDYSTKSVPRKVAKRTRAAFD